jgi:uncharacterized protein YjbJ (UPF0337 family)
MSMVLKAKSKAEIAKGRVKVALGSATGNKGLQAKGALQQVRGNITLTGDRIRDAIRGFLRR